MTIFLDSKGGSSSINQLSVTAGEKFFSRLPVPILEGATFMGWFNVGYVGKDRVNENTTASWATDITLYARWTAPGQEERRSIIKPRRGLFKDADLEPFELGIATDQKRAVVADKDGNIVDLCGLGIPVYASEAVAKTDRSLKTNDLVLITAKDTTDPSNPVVVVKIFQVGAWSSSGWALTLKTTLKDATASVAGLSQMIDSLRTEITAAYKSYTQSYTKDTAWDPIKKTVLPQTGIKGYVDALLTNETNNLVHKTGNETIGGLKTFSAETKHNAKVNIVAPADGAADSYAVTSAWVRQRIQNTLNGQIIRQFRGVNTHIVLDALDWTKGSTAYKHLKHEMLRDANGNEMISTFDYMTNGTARWLKRLYRNVAGSTENFDVLIASLGQTGTPIMDLSGNGNVVVPWPVGSTSAARVDWVNNAIASIGRPPVWSGNFDVLIGTSTGRDQDSASTWVSTSMTNSKAPIRLSEIIQDWSASKNYRIYFAFKTTTAWSNLTTASYTDYRPLIVAFTKGSFTSKPFASGSALSYLRYGSTCRELLKSSGYMKSSSGDTNVGVRNGGGGLVVWTNTTHDYAREYLYGYTPSFPGSFQDIHIFNQNANTGVQIAIFEV